MNLAECANCGMVWRLKPNRLWEQVTKKEWDWWRVKIGLLSGKTITSWCAKCGELVEPDYRKIRDAHERAGPPVCKLLPHYILSGGQSPVRTYEIIKDGAAIKCLCCGLTSHNFADVQEAYCGFCHAYHSVAQGWRHRSHELPGL